MCLLLTVFPVAAILQAYSQTAEGIIEAVIFIVAGLSMFVRPFSVLSDSRTRHLLYPLLGIVALALMQTHTSRLTGGFPISADPYETKLVAIKLLALIIFARLLVEHISDRRRLHIVVGVVLSVGILSCAFGLGKYLLQHNFQLLPSAAEPGFGQFENRNHFAFLMEMTFGLLLGVMTLGWRGGRFLFPLTASLLIWVAVLLTLSRGAFLSIAIQIAFFSVVYLASGNRRRDKINELQPVTSILHSRSAAMVLSVVIALTAGVVIVGGNTVGKRLSSLTQELKRDSVPRSYTRRLEIWRATIQLIRAKPIIGIGFGGFAAAIPKYYDATGQFNLQQAHNDYLELLASGGVIGSCLGLWFVIALIITCYKQLQSSVDTFARATILGSLTGIVGVAVHSTVDFGLHIFINGVVLTALVVLASTTGADNQPQKAWTRFHSSLNPFVKKVVGYSIAGTYLLMFTTAAWAAGTAGVSRLLSREATKSGHLNDSFQAVGLNKWDPEVHSGYAFMLSGHGRLAEAASEYETAAALRPRDYDLWLRLGRTYRQLGDYNRAHECFARSTRQAPFYAEPHWELGTLLLTLGRRAEAFQELAAAVRSNPDLLKDEIRLAWKQCNEDPISVVEALNPQTDAMRIALAHFFVQNNSPDDAIHIYRAVIELSQKDRAALASAFIRQKRFAEAYEVWSGKHE